MFDDRQLAAVRMVAQLGSFREAADALGLSPASLSRHVRAVEAHVGRPLFDRGKAGVRLTAAGAEFLRLSETYEDARGAFVAGLDRLKESDGDRLRIGCGPLTTRALIAPTLVQLSERMPRVRIVVEVDATKEPLRRLRRGALDVVVCDLTHTADLSDLELLILRREPLSFWARPDHPVHRRGPIALNDILRLPLVSAYLHRHWRTTVAHVLGDDAQAWATVARMPVIESNDYALLATLASETDFICAGREEAFAELAALGQLRRIACTETIAWNICMARRAGTTFPSLDLFWRLLAQSAGAADEQEKVRPQS